jgi:hypothetical protein
MYFFLLFFSSWAWVYLFILLEEYFFLFKMAKPIMRGALCVCCGRTEFLPLFCLNIRELSEILTHCTWKLYTQICVSGFSAKSLLVCVVTSLRTYRRKTETGYSIEFWLLPDRLLATSAARVHCLNLGKKTQQAYRNWFRAILFVISAQYRSGSLM